MIIYLLNKLFGWDYVQWSNFADDGVARVNVAGDGRVFYWRYYTTRVADIISSPSEVLWLTCSPKKYFPNMEKPK